MPDYQDRCIGKDEDCYNLAVSTMMTKTEFLESEQYSHLADNNVVNSSHKFAKK